MGNGMNKVIPGLYVGNFRDSKDEQQLKDNKITHIVSIHDNAKKLRDDIEYHCVIASDTSEQELIQFFPKCIDFIHSARLKGGNVLVHCLAGVSRSVTIASAYIMTVTDLGWRDAINAIRGVRDQANPNFGFQRQLQKYESEYVRKERKRIKEKFEASPHNDQEECRHLLIYFKKKLMGTLDKDDKLYPLPYKAYREREKNQNTVTQQPTCSKGTNDDNSNMKDNNSNTSDKASTDETQDENSARNTKRDAIHAESSETLIDGLFDCVSNRDKSS